jgi:quinol-cytochrome oxidoreductase complex cytochrome b subunit
MDYKRIVVLVIFGALLALFVLFRNWFARYRSTHPRAHSAFELTTWIIIVVAGLSLIGAILFEAFWR